MMQGLTVPAGAARPGHACRPKRRRPAATAMGRNTEELCSKGLQFLHYACHNRTCSSRELCGPRLLICSNIASRVPFAGHVGHTCTHHCSSNPQRSPPTTTRTSPQFRQSLTCIDGAQHTVVLPVGCCEHRHPGPQPTQHIVPQNINCLRFQMLQNLNTCRQVHTPRL